MVIRDGNDSNPGILDRLEKARVHSEVIGFRDLFPPGGDRILEVHHGDIGLAQCSEIHERQRDAVPRRHLIVPSKKNIPPKPKNDGRNADGIGHTNLTGCRNAACKQSDNKKGMCVHKTWRKKKEARRLPFGQPCLNLDREVHTDAGADIGGGAARSCNTVVADRHIDRDLAGRDFYADHRGIHEIGARR